MISLTTVSPSLRSIQVMDLISHRLLYTGSMASKHVMLKKYPRNQCVLLLWRYPTLARS